MEDGLHFQPSFLNVRPDASSCYKAQGKTGTKVRTVTTRWHAEGTLVRRKKVAVTRQNKKEQKFVLHGRDHTKTCLSYHFGCKQTLEMSRPSPCAHGISHHRGEVRGTAQPRKNPPQACAQQKSERTTVQMVCHVGEMIEMQGEAN